MAKSREQRDTNERRTSRTRRAGATIRRALGLLAFLPVASRIPGYARLIWALALDDRMPAGRKALLGGALGYLVLGRDAVPDDVPVVGGLDDLVVVALAVDLFFEGVPRDLLDEKLDELGLDRDAFHRDVAQIRRFTPRPVRNAVRRIPSAIGSVGDAIEDSGIAPRVRHWINREETLA